MTMQMNMSWLTFGVIFSLCIGFIHGGDTIKYASSCSVDLCILNNTSNNSSTNNSSGSITCPNIPLCYNFYTSLNTSICAPQVVCSLFDPCTTAKKCATNTSVCVINTCCSAPVCIPLALTSSCTMYTTNNTKNSWLSTICPNATWSGNSTIAINNNLNGTYWASFNDFFVDNYNNIYVLDTYSYRVLKYALNNPSTFNVVAVTSVSSSYLPNNLYVDGNGTIYTAESWWSGATYYYRVVKYSQSGVTSGTTVFGPTTCGTSVAEICACGGLFVDGTGSIYYSDSSNQRILQITQFSSTATVIAGTSGISGSQLNQLNNPAGIYVDGTGALYVADQSNGRVMKFASGSLTGSVLFTLTSYQSPQGLTLDNAGSVYAGTYSGIFKYVPGSGNTIQIISTVYWGVSRIRFDTYGNLYTGGYSSSNINRYNITANSC